jgi:hypothetical protein
VAVAAVRRLAPEPVLPSAVAAAVLRQAPAVEQAAWPVVAGKPFV